MKKLSNKFDKVAALTIIFLVIFAGIALVLQSCTFLPSVATDERKMFHCLTTVLKNKSDHNHRKCREILIVKTKNVAFLAKFVSLLYAINKPF